MTAASATLTKDQRGALARVFSRSYYSAAGYLYESRPFLTAADASLMDDVRALRMDDRRHALLLAQLVEAYDEVPEPGVFAYWYRDLNYLTLPYMMGFLCEATQDDIATIDEALTHFGASHRLVETTLRTVRHDKVERLALLQPLAEEAAKRETADYAAGTAALNKARADRLAAEKAARDAKRGKKGKAGAAPTMSIYDVKVDEAAAVKGLPDPFEAGVSMEERAKRKIARLAAIRAAKRKVIAASAPAAAIQVDPSTVQVDEAAIIAKLPDPFEAGVSMEERTKRKVARLKAVKDAKIQKAREMASAGGSAAAAAEITPQSLGMADPAEEGISPKEKAKRQIQFMRAKKKAEKEQAAGGAAPAAAGPDLSPAALGVADPDEPGIDNKEKGKRRVLYNRAKKKALEG